MGKRDLLRWAGMGAADEVMSERLHCDGTMDGIGGGGGNWGEIGGEYRAPAPLYVADNNLSEKQVPVAHAARTRGNGPACSLSLLTP
jgi:hypothetical protein